MSKAKTSPNKVEANRRNAKKSTGPRSAAGKAKSSRNAVKHGLLAERIVLADNPEEDPKQFGLLLDGLRDDYQPQSTIETMLVERLAASFWRLRRAYRFEVETITQANQPNPFQDALNELSPLPPVKRGERILPPQHSLDRLIRYETMIDRELLRTMRQLELRQRFRKIEQAPDRLDGVSHWQQAASGTPEQAPEAQREQHGQEYLPMPPDGASHWQQAASGTPVSKTPAQQPQRKGAQHGQEYLPMPPDQARAESRKPVAAGVSAGRPPIDQRRSTRGSAATGSDANALEQCAHSEEPLLKSSGTLPSKSAKAPAPNEATAAPSAGPPRRCERWSSSSGVVPRTSMLRRGWPTRVARGWGTHAARLEHRAARPSVVNDAAFRAII